MTTKAPAFHEVETWIFDLDNTLYPANCRLFDQIDERMGAFIAERLSVDRAEARRIQKTFFFEHGTTLRGLMTVHDVEPADFLSFVHDIDHSPVTANEALSAELARLPGRKLIYTNGTVAHAECVLDRLGVGGHFDDIFDIQAANYLPKPEMDAYRRFIAHAGIDARRAAMFEDIARNLEAPHALGMTTVLVRSDDNEDSALIGRLNGDSEAEPHVHHVTDDLAGFLGAIAKREA
ncbi:pyrimidine 5'-nucleotidase [Kaustia mangrovi]|uniref:Pyrimidine 5'-nucleotidase n=1 Tax=Kaustia mangrovi TaxID=2593653 RepID=A0A7S8C5M7_9HYPH|nr:pyrimidine 5'-nucleotidase [Kaustia mangrovi]QPC43833.1 pyrimidine 5'-nucleotidase [Kaustia mangrovi]